MIHNACRYSSFNIFEAEQRRYTSLARAHRHEHPYFESVASQIDSGCKVSQSQAATLARIATEEGWRLDAGASAKPSRPLTTKLARNSPVYNDTNVEPEKTTMPSNRHHCSALVGPFGHHCANSVAKKGAVCKWHRKLAKRSRPRWIRPDLRSGGAVVSSVRPASKAGR